MSILSDLDDTTTCKPAHFAWCTNHTDAGMRDQICVSDTSTFVDSEFVPTDPMVLQVRLDRVHVRPGDQPEWEVRAPQIEVAVEAIPNPTWGAGPVTVQLRKSDVVSRNGVLDPEAPGVWIEGLPDSGPLTAAEGSQLAVVAAAARHAAEGGIER